MIERVFRTVGTRTRRGSGDRVRARAVPGARSEARAPAAGVRLRAGVVHARCAAPAATLQTSARPRSARSEPIITLFIATKKACILRNIIIISPLQSTAGHRPLQLLAISLDLHYSHPAPASRPAQIVTPGLRASYSTFT
jgi:hypothetical protein